MLFGPSADAFPDSRAAHSGGGFDAGGAAVDPSAPLGAVGPEGPGGRGTQEAARAPVVGQVTVTQRGTPPRH